MGDDRTPCILFTLSTLSSTANIFILPMEPGKKCVNFIRINSFRSWWSTLSGFLERPETLTLILMFTYFTEFAGLLALTRF